MHWRYQVTQSWLLIGACFISGMSGFKRHCDIVKALRTSLASHYLKSTFCKYFSNNTNPALIKNRDTPLFQDMVSRIERCIHNDLMTLCNVCMPLMV